MASDDECYEYDDGEEEWDGVDMEEDEGDGALLEEAPPPPERPADCWVSNVATSEHDWGFRLGHVWGRARRSI